MNAAFHDVTSQTNPDEEISYNMFSFASDIWR